MQRLSKTHFWETSYCYNLFILLLPTEVSVLIIDFCQHKYEDYLHVIFHCLVFFLISNAVACIKGRACYAETNKAWHNWSSNIWSLAEQAFASMSFGDIYWKTLKFLLKSCSCHYFKDILRSKATFTKGVCIMTQVRASLSKKSSMSNLSAILCAKLLAWKCMPNFKIMFDNQSCHIWHSVRACFCITLFMLRSMQVTVHLLLLWLWKKFHLCCCF